MYLAVIYFTLVGFFIFIIKMSNNSERTIYKTTSMFKKFHDHLDLNHTFLYIPIESFFNFQYKNIYALM